MEKTDNLQELALTTLLAQATSLCQLSALKSFTEHDIHDIRVASRRLRIGLPISTPVLTVMSLHNGCGL